MAIVSARNHVLRWLKTCQSNVSASIQQGAEAGIPFSAFKLVIGHIKLRQEVTTLHTQSRQAMQGPGLHLPACSSFKVSVAKNAVIKQQLYV